VGLLLAVPSAVALVVEPVLGIVAAGSRRRPVVVAGGACYAAGALLAATATSFPALLVAYALLYPAAGAFVSLSQATLMDVDPARREHNMARWTLAGAIGALAGPLLVGACAAGGLGWRALFASFGALAALLALRVRRQPAGEHENGDRPGLREAARVLVDREVLRWLVLGELANLLLDVFLGFLALYLVDVQGASPATGGLAVAVWTAAGLAGSAAAVPLLRRVDGLRYLRLSALAAAPLLGAFLLVPGTAAKLSLVAALGLAGAGWYPVLQARLYGALGPASGLALTVQALVPLDAVLPLAVAALAGRVGLGPALWTMLAAPAALLLLVPRRSSGETPLPIPEP
jgi:FSR family fosmidomycin resistance protein-like MFS transporter